MSSGFGVGSLGLGVEDQRGDIMGDNKFDFEKLLVYQKALIFISLVYSISEKFPSMERFALTDQFRRASTSIALNISEGTGGSIVEFKKFLRIARRSVRECVAITSIAKMKQYINNKEETELRSKSTIVHNC